MMNQRRDWVWFLVVLVMVWLVWTYCGFMFKHGDTDCPDPAIHPSVGVVYVDNNGPAVFVEGDSSVVYEVTCVTDTVNQVCVERGHVKGDVLNRVSCPDDEYIDSPDMTLRVRCWSGDTVRKCERCGVSFEIPGIWDTTVVWQRE